MLNHVTNKIIFDAAEANRVFGGCCPNGLIDFNILVPQPPHIYMGDLSSDDEEDFACNWHSWRRENWGTKWNAYSGSTVVEDNKAIITFDTAWNIPYPIVSAFANRFSLPFEHRYFDDGHCFWGVEAWGVQNGGLNDKTIRRIRKSKSLEADKKALCIELLGYDPDAEDESEDAA